jgi:hypothetical protein
MKAVGGVEVWLHCFIIPVIDGSDGQLCSMAVLTFGETAPESFEQEAVCSPKPVWTLLNNLFPMPIT